MTLRVAPTAFVLGLERFGVACLLMAPLEPLIPKHDCGISDVLLGFHYGYAKEHEICGDCR
jgi:hypothetical protein